MAKILTEAIAAGMRQSPGKNQLQASSHHFLHSIPTSTWVILEYNTQSSARVNSESVLISNNSRKCNWGCVRWTNQGMTAELCDVPEGCHHSWPWNMWPAEQNTTMQWWRTVPAVPASGLGGWANRHFTFRSQEKAIQPNLIQAWPSSEVAAHHQRMVGMWTVSVYLPRYVLQATGSWTGQVLAQTWFGKFYLVFLLSSALPNSTQRCTEQMLWLGAEIPTNWPGFSMSTFLSSEVILLLCSTQACAASG